MRGDWMDSAKEYEALDRVALADAEATLASRSETIEMVSVEGGKFHRPADTAFSHTVPAWTPRLMLCGRSLVPYNFFATRDDANNYTGGRLASYACQHCERVAQKAVSNG